MKNDIFVKLNYKTIGELKSLIVDREHKDEYYDKYLMCTGKYDKSGWTFIFKANSMEEAEEIINNSNKRSLNRNKINEDKILMGSKNISEIIKPIDRIQIPAFI
ncbi:hypothetical protein [Clostridium sp.]|uniref:hypothetical protein n=1 Tax=Clostridium sp. TaxID=1506 RepID=UPI0026322E54|nr:hypothetical protein [Clostridium sp.]